MFFIFGFIVNLKVCQNSKGSHKSSGCLGMFHCEFFLKSSFCVRNEKLYLKIGVVFGHEYKLELFFSF